MLVRLLVAGLYVYLVMFIEQNKLFTLALCTISLFVGFIFCASLKTTQKKRNMMDLGNFSVSLAVKDLKTSKLFYEKLGFGGEPCGDNWTILKNGDTNIGLFQGMFEKNILTFNPGWDSNAQKLSEFNDVRVIQRRLKERGIKMVTEADEKTTGPASFLISDPDGNTILVDQHV